MLHFGQIIKTPENDLTCVIEIKTIKVNSDNLEFNSKQVALRFPCMELANKQLETEWCWHIRGEVESYTNKCRQVWDDLTCGDAPLMRKPEIDKSFDLIDRYIKYLYTDMGFYLNNTCRYFKSVLLHLQYILPPVDHQWRNDLESVISSITDLVDLMEAHISEGRPLAQFTSETEQN